MSTRRFTSLLIGLFCLVLALPATADWGSAFGASTLETYMLDGTRKVLLLTAGGDAEARKKLRGALLDDINRIEGVTGVTVGALNGTDHDDETLRRKARPVPADVVLIVRLFEKQPGRTTVVGTFYERAGRSYAAFALGPGESLQPRDIEPDEPTETSPEESDTEKTKPSKGLSRQALESVYGEGDEPREEPAASKTDGERMYNSRVLAVRAASFTGEPEFEQGARGFPITPEQALEKLGRPDLAETYATRRRLKAAGIAGSIAVAGGSVVLMVVGIRGEQGCNTDAGCARPIGARRALIIGGVLGAVVGVSGLVYSIHYSAFPLSLNGSEDLVDEHNEALRNKFDVDASTELSTPKPALELSFGAGPMGKGAGLMLRGRF